jgi:hypothetical protein
MPREGFEITISMFERAQTVHNSGRAATVNIYRLHSPIRPHGVVLNYLRTRTMLPSLVYIRIPETFVSALYNTFMARLFYIVYFT